MNASRFFTWIPRALCGLTLGLALTGCSSFKQSWKNSTAQPAPDHALTGPWEGEWISSVNGHHERLRCLVTHQTNDVYQAWFHARWKGLLITFSATYKVELQAQVTNGTYHFQGAADLGKLKGGRYQCEGRADGARFDATYHSQYDHGKFEMARPGSPSTEARTSEVPPER